MHDVPSIGNDRRNVSLRGKQFLISNKFYFVTSFSRSRYILAFISYQTNFRLRRVSSNFNIPFYLTVVSHFEQCYSTVGRTRSFSLLLDSFKRDRKQMYIYIYIYRGGGAARWACSYNAVTSVNRAPQLESNDGFHSLPSRQRLVKLNEIAIWKLIAGCSDVSSRIANLHRLHDSSPFFPVGEPTPPRNLAAGIRSKSESLIFMVPRLGRMGILARFVAARLSHSYILS